MEDAPKICDRCHKPITPPPGSIGTGYGISKAGEVHCYACCGEMDREHLQGMKPGERWHLYLITEKETGRQVVTNWPGTLKLAAYGRTKGGHNIAGTRQDVRFTLDGAVFAGTQYGNFSDILHIRKLNPRQ